MVGSKDLAVRYRMSDPRALPKFGSAKNPFRETAKAPLARAITRSPASELKRAATAPGREPEKVSPRPARPSRRLEGISRMMGKVTGLLSSPRPKATKPAIPEFAKPAVQAELSLDKIRVVRNDLSDADLEIVPVQPPKLSGQPGAGPTLQIAQTTEPTETAWGRVASRFFGADKT